jgi:hypothetical protein
LVEVTSSSIIAADEEQAIKKQNHIIKITQCLSDPCAVYYTDSLSQSILIVCTNPKHTDSDSGGKGIEKLESGVDGDQPNSDANLLKDTPSQFTDPITTKEQ